MLALGYLVAYCTPRFMQRVHQIEHLGNSAGIVIRICPEKPPLHVVVERVQIGRQLTALIVIQRSLQAGDDRDRLADRPGAAFDVSVRDAAFRSLQLSTSTIQKHIDEPVGAGAFNASLYVEFLILSYGAVHKDSFPTAFIVR